MVLNAEKAMCYRQGNEKKDEQTDGPTWFKKRFNEIAKYAIKKM